MFSEAPTPLTAACETWLCAAGRHKDSLTRGERKRGEGGFQHSRVFAATGGDGLSRALPWRQTDRQSDTHGSLAVEADLPRWGAHDD